MVASSTVPMMKDGLSMEAISLLRSWANIMSRRAAVASKTMKAELDSTTLMILIRTTASSRGDEKSLNKLSAR